MQSALPLLLLWAAPSMPRLAPAAPGSLRPGTWLPRELGRFRLPHAGFVEVYDTEGGDRNLFVTTFNAAAPYFHDPVYFLGNPGELLDSIPAWTASLVTLGGGATAYWPNFPVELPSSVVGFQGIVQTSGFLVPGKHTGKLELYDVTDVTRGPIDIAAGEEHAWSYHWVIWKDVDGDGHEDAFTARFRVPGLIPGDPIAQLVWFKNPGTAPPEPGSSWPWESFLLLEDGPDVYFEETVFEVDGLQYSAIVAGELWTERIMLYLVEDVPGAWADPANIQPVVVDAAPGQPFEAHFADVNNDGRLEILASCYDTRKGNKTGNLWVYEQPLSGLTAGEPWARTALASGFKANSFLFGNSMTPGKSRLFWPSEEYRETLAKPWVALSGDDDGVHYILIPSSEDPASMEYDIQVMVDTEGTTAGTMAVTDLDRDGFTEIVSAGYTKGEVYVFTFKPEQGNP